MIREFREFLFEQNALALAVGVIIGSAAGRVVSSIVSDLLMPIISLVMPGGDWRSSRLVLSTRIGADGKEVLNAVNYGSFIGTLIDFIIVAFVVFMILRMMLKPAPATASAPTKDCPFCKELLPIAATRCRACTSALT